MRLPGSAAVYVRQSLDRAEGASIQRQIEDTQKLAHSLGWTIGEVYEDNDVSAYNRRKKRPSWTRMLDDLRSGKHDGVIFYDLDRMARQPRDLEDLIDILEQHKIPNSIVTGEVNLSTGDGILMARMLVSMANKSSRDTGRRVARAAQQRAEQGKPQKAVTRPFGYTHDYEIIESEATLIRQAYERVIAGESLTSILKDWQQVPTVAGKSWHRQTVKKILQAPRNAAIATYKGKEVAQGNWQPIVTREVWDAAQDLFKSRTQPMPDTTSKYLLSRIARCGKCGSHMYGRAANKTRKASYTCMSALGGCGGINRQMKPVDDYISELIKTQMAKSKPEPVAQHDYSPEIERIENKIAELIALWNDDKIETQDFIRMRDPQTEKLKALQRKKAETSATEIIDSFAENFDDANLSQQRAMIKRYLDAVTIMPATRGARKVDLRLIVPTWKKTTSS